MLDQPLVVLRETESQLGMFLKVGRIRASPACLYLDEHQTAFAVPRYGQSGGFSRKRCLALLEGESQTCGLHLAKGEFAILFLRRLSYYLPCMWDRTSSDCHVGAVWAKAPGTLAVVFLSAGSRNAMNAVRRDCILPARLGTASIS